MVNVIKVSKLALMASVLIGSIPCVHAMNDDFKKQLNSALSNPNKKVKAADEYAKAVGAYQVPKNTPVKRNTQIEEKKAAVDGTELEIILRARKIKEQQNPAEKPRVLQDLIDSKEKKLVAVSAQIVKNDSFKEVSVYRKQPQPTGPANLYQKTEEETILPPIILQKK